MVQGNLHLQVLQFYGEKTTPLKIQINLIVEVSNSAYKATQVRARHLRSTLNIILLRVRIHEVTKILSLNSDRLIITWTNLILDGMHVMPLKCPSQIGSYLR